MYSYEAVVKKVYDGDTITVDIDLGFGIWMMKQKIRLYGINTPEIRGDDREQGLISRDVLRGWIPLESTVIIHTVKDKKGKYGRWLGTIHIPDVRDPNQLVNLNEKLVNEGYAVEYLL